MGETRTCRYCLRVFTVEDYHEREGLVRFCSHGCRLAVEAPLSNGGQSFTSLDAVEEPDIAAPPVDPEADLADVPEDAMRRLTDFFSRWLRLPPPARDTVAKRITDRTAKTKELDPGSTPQAAHVRMVRAARRIPELKCVLMKNRPRRAPAARCAVQ